MKKIFFGLVFLAAVLMSYQIGRTDSDKAGDYQKIDVPMEKIIAEPREGAKTVFKIPIAVRLIACTPDKKWYKARISYNFIQYYEYSGWVKVE